LGSGSVSTVSEFSSAVCRVRADFLEMPGLRVTDAQAARLWSLDAALCLTILNTLVQEKFLVRTDRAVFSKAQAAP
jgi:hypothetical protein